MLNVWWLRLLRDIQILSGNISCLYVNELCNIHGTQDSEARSPHRVATCKLNVITFFRLAVACIKLCIQITIWPCMKFVTRKGFVTEMLISIFIESLMVQKWSIAMCVTVLPTATITTAQTSCMLKATWSAAEGKKGRQAQLLYCRQSVLQAPDSLQISTFSTRTILHPQVPRILSLSLC